MAPPQVAVGRTAGGGKESHEPHASGERAMAPPQVAVGRTAGAG